MIMPQLLGYMIAMILAIAINSDNDTNSSLSYNVKVFYYLQPDWGESISGIQRCANKKMSCDWEYSGNITQLVESFNSHILSESTDSRSITVAMYNLHSLWHKLKKFYPLNCLLKTDLSLACSEESSKHPSHSILFAKSFPNFDGYSTTHPSSSFQKVYQEAYLNQTILDYHTTNSMKSFSQLIKAGTYIASACHNKNGIESSRDKIVKAIRAAGFRIDGLGMTKLNAYNTNNVGACLKSSNPEGIVLTHTEDSGKNIMLKRAVIAKYLFNMAFENVIDLGYVTEKPWDALLAGTVPVYWGDSTHLRALIPHPKSVIFVSDFEGDQVKLANYLKYLSLNETAYEEHRNWRKHFNSTRNTEGNDLLRNSWYCNTCAWAINKMSDRDNIYHDNSNDIKNGNGHISQNDGILAPNIRAQNFNRSIIENIFSNSIRHDDHLKSRNKQKPKQNNISRVVDVCT